MHAVRFIASKRNGVLSLKQYLLEPLLKTGSKKSRPSHISSVWTGVANRGMAASAGSSDYESMTTLEKLNFDNLALRVLPIDPETSKESRTVPGACFSRVEPIPVKNPQIVAVSSSAVKLLDLDQKEIDRPEFVNYFGGCKVLPGSEPAAHCYCGHQFGYFSGQLGDGAAMYLGEVVNKKGERWEVQLKGAGRTPYSRTADGRKVLRSSIREFLCSEAMHYLGIPTTRAGSCITSDTTVVRDIFYDGNAKPERCTVVSRFAPTFIRFGSFEIFKDVDAQTGRMGPSRGRTDILTVLLDYVVTTFYPEIWAAHKEDKEAAYLGFYREIVSRTARLVAQWQGIGWCHGVLNTDNMSIVGATIDYGPFGFMDMYDPDYICNASDDGGRYTYSKQPAMCKWNLLKLAEALAPVVPRSGLDAILDEYDTMYDTFYHEIMMQKLGLQQRQASIEADKKLISGLFAIMQETGADFTNTFRALSKVPVPGATQNFEFELASATDLILAQCCSVDELKALYKPRMDPRQLSMFMSLLQMNPDLLAQLGAGHQVISMEIERREKSEKLKDLTPESKLEADRSSWTPWLQQFTERLKLDIEEGSEDKASRAEQRRKNMDSVNPRFVLRNYIAQNAISAAEEGDFSEVQRVLRLLQTPYSDEVPAELSAPDGETSTNVDTGESCSFTSKYSCKPPSWAADLRVT